MDKWLLAVFWSALFYCGIMVLLWLTVKILSVKMGVYGRIRYSSIVGLTMFLLSVSVPYHLQGYSSLDSPWNQPALGFAKFPPFSFFAFFFSVKQFASTWLLITSILFFLTSSSSMIFKFLAILITFYMAFSFQHINDYEIIRAVG